MAELRENSRYEVSACTCDRCGRLITSDVADPKWSERVSIAYRAGSHSIFGDGQTICIDLCQHCVRETLGQWLNIAAVHDDHLKPSSDSLPVSALRGNVRHAGDAVSIEAMNALIADGVTPLRIDRCPIFRCRPDSPRTWIALGVPGDRVSGSPRKVRELRELHYVSDRGVGCSDTAACVRWTPKEGEQAAESILERMRTALTRPVLQLSGSRQESDRRWLGAERLADSIRQPPSLRAEMEAESVAAVPQGDPEGRVINKESQDLCHFGDGIAEFVINVSWVQGYESTNSMLHGKRPRERLATDPAALVEAARDLAEGPMRG